MWHICDCIRWERDQRHLATLFTSAKIPARYCDKTLENFNQTRQPRAFSLAAAYLENWDDEKQKGRGLFFIGGVGSGKTHLAYALMGKLVKQGVRSLAVTVPDLLDDLRPKAGDINDKQREQISTLKNVDLLLLDDLGAQRDTPWVTERLFIIINARYNGLLPTIFTSNETPENLEKSSGWKRIVDRIVEMSTMVRLDDGIRSYRLK